MTQQDVNARHQAKLDALGGGGGSGSSGGSGGGSPCECGGRGDVATSGRSSRAHTCASCDQINNATAATTNQNKAPAAAVKQQQRLKQPFSVNNFEHRHAAQQKILEAQQKQIKEQQRLIEELQYLQKQQMLQQQLLQQESAKAALSGGGASGSGGAEGVQSIHNTLAHLQTHIARLQRQLTASYDAAQVAPPAAAAAIVHDIAVTDCDDDDAGVDGSGGGGHQQRAPAASESLRIDLSCIDADGGGGGGAKPAKPVSSDSRLEQKQQPPAKSTAVSKHGVHAASARYVNSFLLLLLCFFFVFKQQAQV